MRCCICGRAGRAPCRWCGNDRRKAALVAASCRCRTRRPVAPAGLRTVPWRSRRHARAGAKNPIASSPSLCAAGARYPSPGGRHDRHDCAPCTARDSPHLRHIAFFALHSRTFCRVAMSFSPQSNRPVRPALAIKRHAPTTGGGPAPLQIGERGNRFLRTGANNARCRIAMQSANCAEIHADMPTQCLDARRAQIHCPPTHPAKAFRPVMLEPKEGGPSNGAVFKRIFGVSCLYEIRCYKSRKRSGQYEEASCQCNRALP